MRSIMFRVFVLSAAVLTFGCSGEIDMKPHPTCGVTHAAIDAAIDLYRMFKPVDI